MFASIAREKRIPDWLAAAEPLVVFALIMLYIWRLRFTAPNSWLLILAIVLLSHIVREEQPETLGFRTAHFSDCMREYGAPLLFIALTLVSTGLLLRTTRDISFDRGLECFLAYCPWGLFQQYLLNGYFGNRLRAAGAARHAPVLAAALFAAGHLPNGFLMVVTFAGGYCCATIYRRFGNLYFLGLAHAVIGFLLYWVAPDSVSHHLNVGPTFLR